jgi:hypothetical protein
MHIRLTDFLDNGLAYDVLSEVVTFWTLGPLFLFDLLA